MNISLEEMGVKLQKLGKVYVQDIVLKFRIPDYDFYIFRDGRILIYGTTDENIAKSLYAKYVGI